ncbi:sigma-54 interaction domain-containing protein [Papillibacter cinnamivorans]|uniref:Transcriptional regulator containing PAS, AAA-type ATPase, and DNA-binding Fis domains n=1 Tax=Papillibacter cinnamivorans DSM 12816 TaxID=1122930 RepID=A0A1W2ABB6_9FIRM|nr:sigma 54-interacting transcriptional regulator [Papillibacter cinnamivorans]SMC57751.1 Transcriptional regulator containing PAS, AAA-type ATPase, and DNA-binding Fis domains [Papillibacter cinnamivorans DSM 12816]
MENYLSPELLTQFIESLDAFAVLNKEGKYLYVSPNWVKTSGVPSNIALAKYVWQVVPDTHSMHVLETGEPVLGEVVNIQGIQAFTSYMPIMKNGVVDGCFIFVILTGMEKALAFTRRVNQLSTELEFYKQELSRERGARYGINSIIGNSSSIQRVKAQIAQAAKSSSTVLIDGETGSGKELIAHAIHSLSSRRQSNFVRVNCSAIPSELMEAEFFGYVGGAFTGAAKKGKIGRFELAGGGSIFLDEVNLLSPTMQPKFLRVLQEQEIDPVGGDKSIPIDVRVIAASNIPLEPLVEEGKFRSDLFFRLNVIRITAPPLRNRKEDIPLLVESLIKRLNSQLGMLIEGVTDEVMDLFMEYEWPGNVRELQNVIESAMNMTSSNTLKLDDFQSFVQRVRSKSRRITPSEEEYRLKSSKQNFERDLVRDALAAAKGNRVRAAEILGISRTVLYKKLEKYNLK